MSMKYRYFFAAACGVALCAPAVSIAATYTVDRFDDTTIGLCAPGVASDCALRGAIRKANANPGIDIINLPAGDFGLGLSGSGEDVALTGDLDITGATIITGAGMDLTIIDAGGNSGLGDSIFQIHVDAELNMSKLTLGGGMSVEGGEGGGIHNRGIIELTEVRIVANSAHAGGGIYNEHLGILTVIDSVIEANNSLPSGPGVGAGIYNAGVMTMERSSVFDNGLESKPGVGGGIYSQDFLSIRHSKIYGNKSLKGGGFGMTGSASMFIISSEVSGNSAESEGGGIWFNNGNLTISKTTIDENTVDALGLGGGIWNSGSAEINNSTISGNKVGGGTSGSGGGIWSDGSLTLSSVTVVNNDALGGDALYNNNIAEVSNSILQSPNLAADPCGGLQTLSAGGNLISADPFLNNNNATCGFLVNDQIKVTLAELNLGLLAENGGPTRTHALLTGSFAIGGSLGGIGGNCNGVDQRGWVRIDGDCDVGAFELDARDPDILFIDGFESQ